MKTFRIFLILSAILVLFQSMAHAFDAKKVFLEADKFYIKGGEESRAALPLFKQVIEDGRSIKYVKLAKLKVSFIYDDHLMEYENAINESMKVGNIKKLL